MFKLSTLGGNRGLWPASGYLLMMTMMMTMMKVLDQASTVGRHSKLRPVTSFEIKQVICFY